MGAPAQTLELALLRAASLAEYKPKETVIVYLRGEAMYSADYEKEVQGMPGWAKVYRINSIQEK